MPRRRSRFRPCIDLHDGKVKQIVGGTLKEGVNDDLKTNYVSEHPPAFFAKLYRDHDLQGGHVIKLGSGNDDAAREALKVWPGHFQIGGGINQSNATEWLDAGASKVIVTSHLFHGAHFDKSRLEALSKVVGVERLVVDVSCRRKGDRWIVAMNKWQDLTDLEVNQESLEMLSSYCSEFLVHAADVEGLCLGIDTELVQRLGEWCPIPVTYAGGAKSVDDLRLVDSLSNGRVDLTYGSSLDIYGGKVIFEELAELDEDHRTLSAPKRFNAWSIFTAAATVAITAALYRGAYISTRAAIILLVSSLFQLSWVVQSSDK